MTTTTERERRRAEFVKALATFLGGVNQARMSIALSLPRGELHEVALLWRDIRVAVPQIHGYPTVEEAGEALRDFLGW